MKSDLVVISWWSNCLALECLHRLVDRAGERSILVVQAGKPEQQKATFRAYLPAGVKELPYPASASGEDWRVRETVARELLADRAGVWFVDHDLFLEEDAAGWLEAMDRRLESSGACLCHPGPRRGPSITNPIFWLSPARLPAGMPSFARVPYIEDPLASRPYAARQGSALIVPGKDTLVAAMEFLAERGRVGTFPLNKPDRAPGGPAPFPKYRHLGGLYTFTAEVGRQTQDGWLARCVAEFSAFYRACRPEWVAVEDPVLLERLEEFRQAAAVRPGAGDS